MTGDRVDIRYDRLNLSVKSTVGGFPSEVNRGEMSHRLLPCL